ncbi:M56 family metallopeptidase [Tundrisphaera sp. TA3]|uniref:M56 family metallopeptidase n=1 Tax=Tundrisphaera sp. TA3 TaxID=3435775 RepID=UPI003EB94E7B
MTISSAGAVAAWIWLALLHAAWLGLAAPALVAWLFQLRWTMPRRARHATLVAALASVAAGPPLLASAPHLAPGWVANELLMGGARVVILPGEPGPGIDPVDDAHAGRRRADDAMPSRSFRRWADRSAEVAKAARPYGLAAWSLAALAGLATLALGVGGVARLCRDASPAPADVAERAGRLGRRLGLRKVPSVLVHPGLVEPCLCGFARRAAILLPGRWLASAGPDAIDAVLAHELAHARWRDSSANVLLRLFEAAYGFHPGVVWLSRAFRRQREHLADALAVRLTGDPLALARALESVARLRLESRSMPMGAALGGETSALLPRIQELLGMMPARPRPSLWPFAAFPPAVGLALVATSLGFSQDKSIPLEGAPAGTAPPPVKVPAPAVPPKTPADPARPNAEPEPPQISFDIRAVAFAPFHWRAGLEGRVETVEPASDLPRWLLDERATRGLLKRMLAEPSSNLIQAPRVTAYDEAHAVIQFGGKLDPGPGEAASYRFRVDVSGTRVPAGLRVDLDLRAPALPTDGAEKPASRAVAHRGTVDIPEGLSLIVDLGRSGRRPAPGREPEIDLVMITPRRIIPKAKVVSGHGLSRVDTKFGPVE